MQGDNVLIVKRNVKYPRIELKTGVPMLILPQNNNFNVDEILQKHREWINQKLEFIKRIEEKYKNQKIYTRSNDDFIKLVTNLIDESAIALGKKPSKIIFRYMKTKWASCSQQGKITFNLMLKYLPPRLIRYVVFHEMVHLLVPNHKQNFWNIIKKQFKNFNQYEEQLFGYWFLLQNKELN